MQTDAAFARKLQRCGGADVAQIEQSTA
jgi:hypothetical protein